MKLNKQINIKGTVYKIKLLPVLEMEGRYGHCDFKNKIIAIEQSLKNEDLRTTLLHEIGHALLFEIGMLQAISIEMHEIIVENYANEIEKHFKISLK